MQTMKTDYELYLAWLETQLSTFINSREFQCDREKISLPSYPMTPFHRFHFIRYFQGFEEGSDMNKYHCNFSESLIKEWKNMSRLEKLKKYQEPYLRHLGLRDMLMELYFLMTKKNFTDKQLYFHKLCKKYERGQVNVNPMAFKRYIISKVIEKFGCIRIQENKEVEINYYQLKHYRSQLKQYETQLCRERHTLIRDLRYRNPIRQKLELMQYYQYEMQGKFYEYKFTFIKELRTKLKVKYQRSSAEDSQQEQETKHANQQSKPKRKKVISKYKTKFGQAFLKEEAQLMVLFEN